MSNIDKAKVEAFKRAMKELRNQPVGTTYSQAFTINGVRIEVDASVYADTNDARRMGCTRVEPSGVRHGAVGACFTIHN